MQATTISREVDPASGIEKLALAVWVTAAKRVTRMAPFNNRVIIWFFIQFTFFDFSLLKTTTISHLLPAVLEPKVCQN